MGNEWPIVWTALCILVLTFLSDVTELAFANLEFFIRTLRFWLYFLAHFAFSCLAAIVLHLKLLPNKMDHWYVAAPVSVFMGVGLFARTNIEIAGMKIAPIGKGFTALKEKMLEQAAEEKADRLYRGKLIGQLEEQSVEVIESRHKIGLMAAKVSVEQVEVMREKARSKSRDEKAYKSMLVEQVLNKNRAYVEEFLKGRPKLKK